MKEKQTLVHGNPKFMYTCKHSYKIEVLRPGYTIDISVPEGKVIEIE